MLSWIRRLTRSLEESPAPLSYFFAAFLFWVAIRVVLESNVFHTRISPLSSIHVVLSFLAMALWLAVVLGTAAKRTPTTILRSVIPGFIVILLAPSLDYLFFNPTQYGICYVGVGTLPELISRYLTFFGPLDHCGITPGMRIEIGISVVACLIYLRALGTSWLRSLAGTLGAWTVLFSLCALKSVLILTAAALGVSLGEDGQVYLSAYVLICAAAAAVIAALSAPRLFWPVVRDTRFLRAVHYCLLFALGLAYSRRAGPAAPINLNGLLQIALGLASVWLVWVYSVMINNVFDIEIDRINDPQRPLVTGEVDAAQYQSAASWLLAVALSVAISSGFSTLWFMALFAMAYFVYSAPPLRLKTRCAVSKAVIGINSASSFLAGYALFTGDAQHAPVVPVLVVLVGFSLGAHVIDLKDIEGDRKAGIRNLSTTLGLRRAQWFLGGSAAVTYLVFFWFFRGSWFGLVLAAGGLLQFVAITRRNYRDGPVILIQDAVIACAVVYVGAASA